NEPANLRVMQNIGFFVFTFVLLYMGLRPISFVFGDMGMYNLKYREYMAGASVNQEKDIVFGAFMKFMSGFASPKLFFFVCTALYIVPLYSASKKLFQNYWPYAFVMLVTSFSFWAYGTNGIRNGLATTLFIYALTANKERNRLIGLILSAFIHLSMIIPVAAYLVAKYVKKPKFLLFGWFFAILLSLAMGSFWENFFFSLGLVEEDRTAGYLVMNVEEVTEMVELKVGFRWDFLFYSAFGVFAGWYFLIKRGLEDNFYKILFGTYIVANAFWVLVIRANFSNRFAYLSWFLMGLVIIYPLLKYDFFKDQNKVAGRIILLYFAFTYLLTVVLG
ncbi:MAG TPA: EpsG family protein, partial [Flavobacterium sp.]|nr:EpsG family protein [Flavobacterium sp.]